MKILTTFFFVQKTVMLGKKEIGDRHSRDRGKKMERFEERRQTRRRGPDSCLPIMRTSVRKKRKRKGSQ